MIENIFGTKEISWLGGYGISYFNLAMLFIVIAVIIAAFIKMPKSHMKYWTTTGVSYLFGTLVFSFGMVCMSRIAFGGSSVGAIAANGEIAFGVSAGTISTLVGFVLIGAAILLSKNKQHKIMYAGALLTSAVFGLTIDFWGFLPQGLGLGLHEINIGLKFIAFGLFLSIMWAGTPFYYDTPLPKLYGTSFIHSLVENFGFSRKLATMTLDIVLTIGAIVIGVIGNITFEDFTFGDVGIGTVLNAIFGGFVFAFWSSKITPIIKPFLTKPWEKNQVK